MSKVLPVTLQDRPELNLRQGIKSSLKGWKPLISSLYLFYLYLRDGGEDVYSKEIIAGDNVTLDLVDSFSNWIDDHCLTISNAKVLVKQSSLFLAQMEHLQVGLELFLRLAKVQFVDGTLSDSVERTGGNRYAKRIRFSTNMKVLADMIGMYPDMDRNVFLEKWLNNSEDLTIGSRVKEVLVPFTEECQFKIRTISNEIFFQQDGLYARLLNSGDTVESTDAHEPVGPFRILKSYIKEGMHPYITDGPNGFALNTAATGFALYADMVHTTLGLIPKRTVIYQEVQSQSSNTIPSHSLDRPLQLITYGAPGTGKSFDTDKNLIDAGGNPKAKVFRTTFHPDSDYSTFVGAYKPTVKPVERIVQIGQDLKKPNYAADIPQGLKVEDKITYEFRPQAFMNAYVAAWKDITKPVVLIIEEINRGNCAQIFGDLFQLLDRDDKSGYSMYPITEDTDLKKWLSEAEQFGPTGLVINAKPERIKQEDWVQILKGEMLALPPNLFIWATMNTSDQSLFPIDSAFKRRWDWKYVPIREGRLKNGQPMRWKVKFTVSVHKEGEQSVATKDYTYDWWDFLKCVNALIFTTTDSEDKKLGYFFVKPDGKSDPNAKDNDLISADRFVGKVIFYLWNDVFKDYGIETIFKVADADRKSEDETKGVEFQAFFNEDDDDVNTNTLLAFFKHLKLKSDEEKDKEKKAAIANAQSNPGAAQGYPPAQDENANPEG